MIQLNSKNSKGFSLTEMMIVVSVISLLAVIGIPQYSKMKQRTRDIEAKTGLSNLFAAEHSFQSYYSFYHTNLEAIGFSMEGKLYFNIGFGNPTNVVASDYGFVAPVPAALINTKAQCTGMNGTGTDSRCQFVVDVPDIGIVATSFVDVFLAAAISTPSNYADQRPATVNQMEMIARILFNQRTATAIGVEVNEENCAIALENPILFFSFYKSCVEEGIVPALAFAMPIDRRIWVITSKKIIKSIQ
jgi:prepilin-type N-terminal cleavage/methylation domain-containing protein